MVLSVTDKAKAPLAGLKVGDTVSLDFAFQDERWENVAFSFGGSAILAQDGKLAALPDDSLYRNRNPRTAMGFRADNSIVWMTVDGRQNDVSEGVNGKNLGQLMLDAGCVAAINLDGGASLNSPTLYQTIVICASFAAFKKISKNSKMCWQVERTVV